MNLQAVRVIFRKEMARFFRTIVESLISPVISTSLYFIVFGAAIGSKIQTIDGISYGAFIVPGLIMLTVITQSVSNASFAINFPKYIGTFYELLSAPISALEIVTGYVGAAAAKSVLIGLVILLTAYAFVDLPIAHPLAMLALLAWLIRPYLPHLEPRLEADARDRALSFAVRQPLDLQQTRQQRNATLIKNHQRSRGS